MNENAEVNVNLNRCISIFKWIPFKLMENFLSITSHFCQFAAGHPSNSQRLSRNECEFDTGDHNDIKFITPSEPFIFSLYDLSYSLCTFMQLIDNPVYWNKLVYDPVGVNDGSWIVKIKNVFSINFRIENNQIQNVLCRYNLFYCRMNGVVIY